MNGSDPKSAVATAARQTVRNRLPALLDLVQSVTGFLLVAFLCVHLLLDAAILIGTPAADAVAQAFEGKYLFGGSYPWIVSLAGLGLLVLILVHAVLAMRKLPHTTREYLTLRDHLRGFRHGDTRLWWWQALTGVALFFLVAPHLYVVITRPEAIGALESAHRVWAERAWLLYAVLLPVVLLHAGAGSYRLAVKWGWPAAPRSRIRRWAWGIAGSYLALGVAALVAYAMLGLRSAA